MIRYGMRALLFFFSKKLIYGNIVALRQTNLRRFFAYSGIVNSGYLLIPHLANNVESIPSILFYLPVYGMSTFRAFAALSAIDKEKRELYLDDLTHLFSRSPFSASVLALSLLTVAGIPPTVGFFAKFYIFKIGFDAGYYGVVIVLMLMKVFSAFYYLRIIRKMLTDEPQKDLPSLSLKLNMASSFVALISLAAIIIFSIFLSSFLDLSVNKVFTIKSMNDTYCYISHITSRLINFSQNKTLIKVKKLFI